MGKAQTTPAAAANNTDDAALLDDKGHFSGSATGNDDDVPAKQATTPEKVKVRVGNEEIETDPASAAFMNAMMGQIQILSNQVQQNMGTQKAPVADAKKPASYDYSTGLFTEPEVALKNLREEIKSEVKAEMTTAYNSAETQKEFWASFYTENEDLKKEKMIVQAVLTRDYAKLSVMEVGAAAKTLSESVKKELMRLSGGKSDSGAGRGVEGGSTRSSTTNSGQSGDNKILSLSEIIRKRQEARRKATFSKE